MSFDACDQTRKWNEVKIGDNIYMYSVVKKNDTFQVFLTNLIELWVEVLTEDVITKKCRELNRLLNIDSLNCTDIVTNILNNIPEHIVRATVEEIQLRTKIENNPFKFSLNLRKASPDEFWKVITEPLCLSSLEILGQHKMLLDVVKKKDAEIAEYKAEGAELIRKNIETKPFNESDLKTNSFVSAADSVGAFCAMVNIYNSLELQEMKRESASTSESGVSNTESGRRIDSGQSTKTQARAVRSKKKLESTNKSKTLFSNSEKYMSILPTRTRTKKGLNDFI